MELLIAMVVVAVLVIVIVASAVKIVPQARTGVVERLGRYQRTQEAGLTMIVPFVDRMLPLLDMREQVVSFPPQPVITEDNLVVSIDTVVYFQVTDAKLATYGIANYIYAVENLATTTLRNVVGGMNLEETLTSRDSINSQLRGVLDEATTKWGLRVSRVELKAIDPPPSIQDSMEKQMRAERDRRAAILTAEGTKQAEILTAEGDRQSSILAAEGDAHAQILRANAEAEAISSVFEAIHAGRPDPDLLAYQYLQTLPKLAQGDSNKLWVIPSEFTDAMSRMGTAFSGGENPLQNLADAASGRSGSQEQSEKGEDVANGENPEDRQPKRSRPTTAAELDDAPKAPKLDETSLEEALGERRVDQRFNEDSAEPEDESGDEGTTRE